MKKVLLLSLGLLTIAPVKASLGCLDNSWHLTQPFDAKEYHIVTREVGTSKTYCPCPCRKLSLSRGECMACGHKHDIQPWTIVRYHRNKNDIVKGR